jgi:hypothetical protein
MIGRTTAMKMRTALFALLGIFSPQITGDYAPVPIAGN